MRILFENPGFSDIRKCLTHFRILGNEILKELRDYFSIEQVKKIFSIIADKGLLEKVEISPCQKQEALILQRRLNIPFNDCMQAIIARDNSAILISRDHHFELLADITEFKKPEELL